MRIMITEVTTITTNNNNNNHNNNSATAIPNIYIINEGKYIF
jgi:hypothetical protein